MCQDLHSNKHFGYILAETTADDAERLLQESTQFIKVPKPDLRGQSLVDGQSLPKRAGLADILNAMHSDPVPQDASEETSKIIQVDVELAAKGEWYLLAVMLQLNTCTRSSADSINVVKPVRTNRHIKTRSPPTQAHLEDLLRVFDGFAEPGRIRTDWQRKVATAQTSKEGLDITQ